MTDHMGRVPTDPKAALVHIITWHTGSPDPSHQNPEAAATAILEHLAVMTHDQALNPQPVSWPECDLCHVPYVYRRGTRFIRDTGDLRVQWMWQADCKHNRPIVAGDPDATAEVHRTGL